MWEFHPRPQGRPVTVREAIGHLIGRQAGSEHHQPQVIAAWHKSRPGQSLRKACRYVGSFQSVRLDPNKPANTQIKAHLHWHYAEPRQLTITEAQILQSFPEGYRFKGTKGDAKERIFAGCGGSSLGYRMAGYRELLAVEWDANAVETFKLNFPGVPVYHGDIGKLAVDECVRMAGLRGPGELDVLDGSPPCQGFSTAGKRKLMDSRNTLFREYVRLLRGLRPKVFVMENVTGLVKGYMKTVYLEIVRELRAAGYVVKGQVMNAMYYGVPQSRQRVIVIGVRDDLGVEPSHPKPATKPMRLKDAIPSFDKQASKQASKQALSLLPPFNDRYARLWDRVPVGGDAADVIGKGFNSCVKLDPMKPSQTLPKMQTGRGFATICHPFERRAVTIGEAKAIGSFPAGFKLVGSYSEQWARIGNSVPPLLMKAIAGHVKTEILQVRA